jgi:hypothetical protein
MIRAKSKRDAAGAVGTDEGAEEFVALPAGGFEVGGFEGFAVAPGAAFGMADAVVNPPSAVVVPEVVGGFAAWDAEGESADEGGGWGHVDRTAMIHGWMVKSITPGSVVS